MTQKHEMAKRRAELQRQAAARKQQSTRNWLIIGIGVIVVVAAVIGIIAAASGGDEAKPAGDVPTGAAAAALAAKVTSVPASVTDQVGAGSVIGAPEAFTGTPITQDGKPQVLYVGAEYCPFCAAERWAVVQALSRFGTFSNLSFTHSSATDVHANTMTFTFRGATYTSQYLAFTGKELQGNAPGSDGKYPPLDTLTAEEQQIVKDATPNGGGIPFVDLGGKYTIQGATFDVGVLGGRSVEEIVNSLSDPTSGVARSILGAANSITKALCVVTGQQPAEVCNAPGVQAAKL